MGDTNAVVEINSKKIVGIKSAYKNFEIIDSHQSTIIVCRISMTKN